MVSFLCSFLRFVLLYPHQILSFSCRFGLSTAAGLVICRLFYLISFRNPPLTLCLPAPSGIVTYIFWRATILPHHPDSVLLHYCQKMLELSRILFLKDYIASQYSTPSATPVALLSHIHFELHRVAHFPHL